MRIRIGLPHTLLGLALGLLLLLSSAPAQATQQPATQAQVAAAAPELWIPNGPVYASALAGNTLYLGGNFTSIGPATGSTLVLDATTGAYQPTSTRFTGSVYAIVPDGAGGWYVGGNFSAVDGMPRENLAHIRADGALDPTWKPRLFGEVYALAVSGNTLYVGGIFSVLVHEWTYYSLLAIDAVSGAITPYITYTANPRAVSALAVQGHTLYVGGSFYDINGQRRDNLAAFDTTTRALMDWNPTINGGVSTLAVSGRTLYTGGAFDSIQGQAHHALAAIDTITGLPLTWNPGLSDTDYISSLVLSGSRLYISGEFTSAGGQPRKRLAAFDTTTHTLTNWKPDASERVFALAISGNTIYAGGGAISHPRAGYLDALPRGYLAAFDATTGIAQPGHPSVNGPVTALATYSTTVYVGGRFTSAGAVARQRLAAIDLATGRPAPWNPGADAAVRTLALSGNTLYAGGDFTSIGGQLRNHLAALDTSTAALRPWNLNTNGMVRTLALYGNTMYAGGGFSRISGQPRNRLAALDTSTGALQSWNPNVDDSSDTGVAALAVHENIVYVGGAFSKIGGQPRWSLAAVNATTGALTAWNPSLEGWLSALAVGENTLYVGGNKLWAECCAKGYLTAFDTATGTTTWARDMEYSQVSGDVSSLLVHEGRLYAGGWFEAGRFEPVEQPVRRNLPRSIPPPARSYPGSRRPTGAYIRS